MKKKTLLELAAVAGAILIFAYVWWIKLPVIHYNNGINLLDQGKNERAIASFQKALALKPEDIKIRFTLAEAYLVSKDEEKAESEYKKIIEFDPLYAEAYLQLAQIYLSRNMHADVLELVNRASAKGIYNSRLQQVGEDTVFRLAVNYLDQAVISYTGNNKADAYAFLEKSLKLKPDFSYANYLLGYFYYRDGDLEKSEHYLKDAIALKGDFWPAHNLLGDIYTRKGDLSAAQIEYDQALFLNRNNAGLQNDLAITLAMRKNYALALGHLQQALLLEANNPDLRYNQASIYLENKNYKEAAEAFQTLIRASPDYPGAHNGLGSVYLAQGRQKEAKEEFQQEIKSALPEFSSRPQDTGLLLRLGLAYFGAGEYKKAKELVEEVLVLQPDNLPAYALLAKIQEAEGNFRASLATLDKIKAIQPAGQESLLDLKRFSDEHIFMNQELFQGITRQ